MVRVTGGGTARRHVASRIGLPMLESSMQPHLHDLGPSPHAGSDPAMPEPRAPRSSSGRSGSDTVAAHHAKGQGRAADTIWRSNPREQGLLGLTDAIRWFGLRGWSISMPLIDSQPYDLVVDDGGWLYRVQVKTTTRRTRYGVFVVQLCTRAATRASIRRRRSTRHRAICSMRSRMLVIDTSFRPRRSLRARP